MYPFIFAVLSSFAFGCLAAVVALLHSRGVLRVGSPGGGPPGRHVATLTPQPTAVAAGEDEGGADVISLEERRAA